jgi:hypothetical protein
MVRFRSLRFPEAAADDRRAPVVTPPGRVYQLDAVRSVPAGVPRETTRPELEQAGVER